MPETPEAAAPPYAGPSRPDETAESSVPKRTGEPFTIEEYRQFAAEDGRAGKLIGWLLCALFIYTILVASAAIWWTLGET
ncbi:MAG: hypothetical protein AAF907_04945 [Planctomycetota bacterium]